MNRIHASVAGLFVVLSLSSLSACSVVRGESSVSQYSTDTAITTKVKTKLVQSDEVSATRVHVETNNRTVLLSGFVKTKAQARAVVRIARSVEDVKAVENKLVVK